MHNITKLHCTQYAHYTVSPKLTQVQVTQTIQYLFAAWKHCLYLNSFSNLTYVISTKCIVNLCKSIPIIQMAHNP